MKNIRHILLFFGLFNGVLTYSQSPNNDKVIAKKKKVGFYEWLEKKAMISVRKTFDGSSKDEGKPASFFWNKDFKNSDEEFVTVDFGIKIKELQVFSEPLLLLYPKFEWHKDGREDASKKKNDISGGVNIDFLPFTKLKMNPWFTGGADVQRDIVKELTTFKPKLFLSLFSTAQGLPGSNTTNCKHVFVLRYYPYTGIEHYKATDLTKVNATYWANRLFLEYWPITSPRQLKTYTDPVSNNDTTIALKDEKRYLQFTIDVSHRTKIEDKLFGRGNLYWLALGLNIYPDGKDKFGFGIEYTKGDDPASNFVETDKISLGIKVKL